MDILLILKGFISFYIYLPHIEWNSKKHTNLVLQHLLHMKANRFSSNQITNDKKFKRKQTYFEIIR